MDQSTNFFRPRKVRRLVGRPIPGGCPVLWVWLAPYHGRGVHVARPSSATRQKATSAATSGSPVYVAICLLVVVVSSDGCSWRSGNVEHYWGPVLFRYATPPDGDSYVGEHVHFPILLEAGHQWGVVLGVQNRVVASPYRKDQPSADANAVGMAKWTMPFSFLGDPQPGRWNLSLLYLRCEYPFSPVFVSRSLIGLEVGIGGEANGLSVGISRTTEIRPATDGLYLFQYDSRSPLRTVFREWQSPDGHSLAAPQGMRVP